MFYSSIIYIISILKNHNPAKYLVKYTKAIQFLCVKGLYFFKAVVLHAKQAMSVDTDVAAPKFDSGGRRGQRLAPSSSHFIPGKETVPIVAKVGRTLGTVWMGLLNLAQKGFEPQTVQAVASHNTPL